MNIIIWAIIYFIITHLLICSWVRFDAYRRGINPDRWFKFCAMLPILGITIYGIAKRPWKLFHLVFMFWVFIPGVYLMIRYLIERHSS